MLMIPTPHDSLFKATFSQPEHARDIFRTVLPAGLVLHLDFDTLRLESESFIDDQLRASFSDLLFTISLAGHPAFLYALFEHQSTPDELMAYRLLHYMTDIWARYLREHPAVSRLPAVIPVVLHHGERGWHAPTALHDLYDVPAALLAEIGHYLPDFEFLLDDLSTQTDDELRMRAMGALPRLVLWAFQHARRTGDLLAALRSMRDVLEAVAAAPHGVQALLRVLRYITEVSELGPEELGKFLETELDPRVHEAFMTGAERFRQESHRQGLEEGHQKGLVEGRRTLLQELLEERFGPLDAEVLQRLRAADSEQLGRWGRRMAMAETLRDVFADQV